MRVNDFVSSDAISVELEPTVKPARRLKIRAEHGDGRAVLIKISIQHNGSENDILKGIEDAQQAFSSLS